MFRCELCQQVVPPRTPASSLVWETRSKCYPERRRVFPAYELKLREDARSSGLRVVRVRKRGRPARDSDEERATHDPGGRGCELVREVQVCPACADRYRQSRNDPQIVR